MSKIRKVELSDVLCNLFFNISSLYVFYGIHKIQIYGVKYTSKISYVLGTLIQNKIYMYITKEIKAKQISMSTSILPLSVLCVFFAVSRRNVVL